MGLLWKQLFWPIDRLCGSMLESDGNLQGDRSCSTSFSSFLVWPCSGRRPPTSRFASGCEAAMVEPLAGLAVALLLGAYLLYTLIHPERF
jgi:K+-transporting ATPase KdpF subunit